MQAPSAAEPPARGHKREGSAWRGTGQRPHAWYPHGDNDTPCTSLGVPGPPPPPSQTPAPAGTDSSPCPAQLHQGANTTRQTPAPSPQTPHQPQTTSYGARGCSPRTSRHRNPKSIPPTPRGSARTTSPQLPALGAPAARQLPHYYSAQSLPNNRRIVAGGSKKTPTGSCSGTTERDPVPQGCAITDPKTFLPAAAPRRAGSGAGTTGTALPPHRVPLGRHLKGRRVLGMAPLAPHGHSRAAPCPRSVADPELVSGSVLAEEPQSHLLRLGDAQPKPGRSRGWHSLCFQPVSMVNTLCTANVTIFLG